MFPPTAPSTSPTAALLRLRLLRLRVHARAEGPLRLRHPGFALRGAFGRALAALACVAERFDCAPCAFADACAYRYVFETPAEALAQGAGALRGVSHAPHPWSLDATSLPPRLAAGEAFEFELWLFGRAVELCALVVPALARCGALGLGASRAPFSVTRIESPAGTVFDGESFAPRVAQDGVRNAAAFAPNLGERGPHELRVRTRSPLRLQRRGMLVLQPEFHEIVRALSRRAQALLALHEDGAPAFDAGDVLAAAARVRHAAAGEPHGRRVGSPRWSSRQRRTMRLDGLEGTWRFVTDGDDGFAPFLPLLGLWRAAGAGKGTAFGFGRADLELAPSLCPVIA